MEGVATQWSYRYDTAGRLVEVLKDGASYSVYRYDSNGNRIEAATQSGLFAGSYDAQDRLLTYGNFAYEYTANGELKTKTDTVTGQITRYTYDVFGNLTRVELPDGRVIEYVIDGANRRVGKKVNGVLVKGWLYKDSLKPLAELDGAGNVIATFVHGAKFNSPEYVTKGGIAYRIFSDHLGSPKLIVNSVSGAVAARIEYDEFGNILRDTSPGFISIGFAGGIYDTDTGLVRFGVRDYDPVTGRWTAKDPIRFMSEEMDLFGYAYNDPINMYDITGLAGCGPGRLSFDDPWFGSCCDKHDDDYDACLPKDQCDSDFLNCMDDICRQKFPPFTSLYFFCRDRAYNFYIVGKYGGGFRYYPSCGFQ